MRCLFCVLRSARALLISQRKHHTREQQSAETEMTLTKASQKRSRSRDEDSEDVLPRTKRREYNFECSHSCQGLNEDQIDGTGEPHHSQAASASSAPTSSLATSPLAGHTASHRLPHPHTSFPHNSADITAALHNTHLDRHHGYHSPSPPPPPGTPLPSCHYHQHHHHQQQAHHQHHPVLLKDAGILPPSHQHSSLGPLPDVVHETSESYYCQVNRLLRSAHFERLKRVKEPGNQVDAYNGSAFNY